MKAQHSTSPRDQRRRRSAEKRIAHAEKIEAKRAAHVGRHTFRPIVAGEAAWQRQLRDSYVDEPAPDVSLELRTAIVRPISRAIAERVILRYEWLGTLPPVQRYFGIFFGPYIAGVTAVAVGNGTAGAFTSMQYGIGRRELATLTRGACVHWAPPGTNSKLVAWTVRLLRELEPDVKLMVAYADSEAGEIGTIYQASGWTYIGPGAKVIEWVSPSGKVWNTRAMGATSHDNGKTTSRGWAPTRGKDRTAKTEAALLEAGWRKQWSNRKLRYAVLVDRDDADLARRVAAMRLPYPKRPGGQPEGERPVLSGGEGESDDALGHQSREDPSKGSRRSTTSKRAGPEPGRRKKKEAP